MRAPSDLNLGADRLRLEQALGNLVENALRHGGGAVRVEVPSAAGAVEIHVRDQGPGFPEGMLTPPSTASAAATRRHTAGGAGLGLAIVDAIARAHGGGAAAVNRPGGGADVWISIPDESVSSQAHPLKAPSPA